MSPYAVAGIYGLVGGLLGNLCAAILAVTTRRAANRNVVGTALGISGGFILGAAFLDLIDEGRAQSHDSLLIVGGGLAIGMALMIGLGLLLGVLGVGEEEAEESSAADISLRLLQQADSSHHDDAYPNPREPSNLERARLIAIGEGIHNIPEALPIGAALAISPHLGLLIALLMTVENFTESWAIAGELLNTRASNGQII